MSKKKKKNRKRRLKSKIRKILKKKRVLKKKPRKRKLVRKARRKPKPKLYYSLNPNYEFFEELKGLVLKSLPGVQEKIARRISSLGKVYLAVTSGVFLNLEKPTVADLLIVADGVERRKLRNFLRFVEAEVGKEVVYAVMDREEFNYRLKMFDRFIRVLLEGPHQKLINRMGI